MKTGVKILFGVGLVSFFGLLFYSNRKKENETTSGCNGLNGSEKILDMCNHLNEEHINAEKELKKILKGSKSNFECAKRVINVWSKEIKHHFGEEERVVFPAILKKDKSLKPQVDELLKEHDYFYKTIDKIKNKRCINCGQLTDLFCNKLFTHIDKEEELLRKVKNIK